MPARTFAPDGSIDERFAPRDVCDALHTSSGNGNKAPLIAHWAVRRLTPRECERLQGFSDDFTAIPGAADGPRYKALGNSMAVNVMRWLGYRIALVEASSVIDVERIRTALLAEYQAMQALAELRAAY
jgi:site-specific DNA-cytosine methylase